MLSKGRVLERGTHTQLLALEGELLLAYRLLVLLMSFLGGFYKHLVQTAHGLDNEEIDEEEADIEQKQRLSFSTPSREGRSASISKGKKR